LPLDAAMITYAIDPARSQVTASGTIRTVTLMGQTENSLTGALGGSLRAEWQEAALVFSGGSSIIAAPHPDRPFRPSPEEAKSGSLVDNFGGQGRLVGSSIWAAIRDAVADISSGHSNFGEPVTELEFVFTHGTLDYHAELFGLLGWLDLTKEKPVRNAATGNLSRIVDNNLDSISLPIFLDIPVKVLAPNDSRLVLEGQIVATSPVLTIEPNSTTNIGSTQHLAALNVEAGATARMTGGTLVTQAINIAGAPDSWTAKLDLTSTDAIVRSSATNKAADLAKLYNQLKQGFNNGAWTGMGITSSTAAANANTDTGIAVVDNALLGYSTFAGEPVTADSILLKYTYYGDIDQNGQVDADDLTVLASNFGRTSGATQVDGDIDFNGAVNADDLTVFANNFQKGVGNPLTANSIQAVPEPHPIALLAIALTTLISSVWLRRCSRTL
jgi:hypothetical protein